mmetsp:Transcript_10591/g.15808  ORF Transcript_10591/g.15808 Transcript_10591/m.15808 type:complete len:364 (+) Transcript_10591:1-1092(+)
MEHVQLLHNMVGPISRLTSGGGGSLADSGVSGGPLLGGSSSHYPSAFGSGGTVMHLDPEHVRISTRGGSGSNGGTSGSDGDGIACFAELATCNGIFLEHRIESASDNIIVFEIDLAQLRLALQSVLFSNGSFGSKGGRRSVAQSALHNSGDARDSSALAALPALVTYVVVMKLAKRGGFPCLCLDASCSGGSIDVHHAIPVRIMRAAEMQYHLPPRIDLPDVQLELPAERPLRPVVERLRTISPQIFLEGSMAGELTLRIDGDGASIRIFYSKLIPRFEDCKTSAEENNNGDNEPARCTIKVDSKKLHACLQWQATMARSVSSAVLCMVENEMLVLHIMLNPGDVGFFTYYVPVHFLSPDQID